MKEQLKELAKLLSAEIKKYEKETGEKIIEAKMTRGVRTADCVKLWSFEFAGWWVTK